MAKKQIRLSESDLRAIIRESVINYLNENTDEVLDTPERAIHAAHAATADKKKHPGRGKDSKDPAIRARRDRQTKAFGEKAADLMNQEINDPDSMVIGDRGARRMMVANGPHSAYLTNDLEDIDSAKVYDDSYKEGDEPMAIADLKEINPEFYAKIHKNFGTFKGYHDKAKELDDQYLEETVRRVMRRTLKEGWDYPESSPYDNYDGDERAMSIIDEYSAIINGRVDDPQTRFSNLQNLLRDYGRMLGQDAEMELRNYLKQKFANNQASRWKMNEAANFGIDPAAKMLYVAKEVGNGVIAFDPRTKKKSFVPAEEILSNNPEDIIRVSASTYEKCFA